MSAVSSVPEPFSKVRTRLEQQYNNVVFSAGWSKADLLQAWEAHCCELPQEPKVIAKARLFDLICTHAPIAPENDDYFVGKVEHYNLLLELRNKWRVAAARREFGDKLGVSDGSYRAQLDCNSHICPDWESLFKLGVKGIYERALSKSTDYHRAVAMVYKGVITLLKRFDKIHPQGGLAELTERPVKTFREALQISYLFNELIEFDGIQVRSMGRFDVLFNDFYEQDLAAGRLTREQAAELLKYYFIKFLAKSGGMVYGKPFTFGPDMYELTKLVFEVYYEMNVVDPKFHLRVSENTPDELLMSAARLIRDGRNGIVLVNNDMQQKMLIENGKTPADAANYILIGCYEPAVMGVELNCSGAGALNLAKPVEQLLENVPANWQYAEFEKAYFDRLAVNLACCIDDLKRHERLWAESNPSPLFSGPMQSCHDKGKDISEAGAKYNTTGIVCAGLADAVDSLVAIRLLLASKQVANLPELAEILKNDFTNHEYLRAVVLHKFPSWGNNIPEVDELAAQIADFVSERINHEPNARGGVFQAALYAILPTAEALGKDTGTLPNGRLAGTQLTMNTNCENGRDLHGVTALLHSVSSLPLDKFPNGTTLDVTLHPSVVSGNKGIETLRNLIRSYFRMDGNTIQFNIFNRSLLLDAQKHPENYANLQVRVCGWNLRFIDLAPEEQQIFIERTGDDSVC